MARLRGKTLDRWRRTAPGSFAKADSGNTFGFLSKEHPARPAATVTANCRNFHWAEPRQLTAPEIARLSSFPDDYDYGAADGVYVCGMSVPPFMMQRVAAHVARTLKGGVVDVKPRTGPWRLAELKDVPRNGLKVFSCFACGGGSTMGYKLAGFDVLGCNEIDPLMMDVYRRNHHPQLSYLEPIQTFKARTDLPSSLYELDVLDGSPPCSSFSTAGNREKDWGKKKRFREGQAEQVLDDLFFHFIDVAARLRPKAVVAENVKGLIMGAARDYVRRIFKAFDAAGYDTQLFLLDASRMGVPQRRERTFFIARRRDLGLRKVDITAAEPWISCRKAFEGLKEDDGKRVGKKIGELWAKTPPGQPLSKAHEKGSFFNEKKCHPDRPSLTLCATARLSHWKVPRLLNLAEAMRLQTFPEDFDFGKANGPYICGMSVPPFMMQRVALRVATAFR